LRLLQVRGRQVKVLGWVQRPGAYAMERQPWRLSDALAAAGGPLPASDEQVRLRRLEADGGQGTSLQTLNLRDLREQVQTQADPVLVPGDVIWVGPTPQVHVQGEVLQPGPQSWQEGDTVARALARAGQSRLRASAQRLQLIRQGSSGSSGVQVLEQPSPSSPLQPGDVLVLSDRGWP
jgi:polysaccharide export outer membrane protein